MALTALLLALSAQPGTAVDVCAEVSREAADTAQAAFVAAQPLLIAEDWPGVEARLLEAVRHDPGHALAHYALGQALLGQQRPRQAAAAFAHSREAFRCVLGADPVRRERLAGEQRARIEQLRSALRRLEHQLTRERSAQWQEVNSRQPMPTRGSGMAAVRELEKRLDELERAARGDDPAPVGVGYALGTALIQAGEIERAASELRDTVARDPDHGDAYNNLAVALMLLGEIEEATAAAQRAEELGVPVSPRLHEELARRR